MAMAACVSIVVPEGVDKNILVVPFDGTGDRAQAMSLLHEGLDISRELGMRPSWSAS